MRAAAIIALAALAGCQVAAPQGGGVSSGGASVPELSAGMTPAQAMAALGADAGFERNPSNWDQTCISYADPRGGYVHAVFDRDVLRRATGGHAAICTYPDTL